MIPGFGPGPSNGWGQHAYSGLHGFGRAELPEPVAVPFLGARTFVVRLFGEMPTGPLVSNALIDYASADQQVIGGLHSIFTEQHRWGTGVNRAQCLRGTVGTMRNGGILPPMKGGPEHRMPRTCGCGFWAYCTGRDSRPGDRDVVWGVVQGWGRMVIGDKGFRAESARIVALAFPLVPEDLHFEEQVVRWRYNSGRYPEDRHDVTDREQLTHAIRTAYPAPAYFDSVEAMYAEYPLTDLEPLLTDAPPDDAEGCEVGS